LLVEEAIEEVDTGHTGALIKGEMSQWLTKFMKHHEHYKHECKDHLKHIYHGKATTVTD
jgi:hypothetical protein